MTSLKDQFKTGMGLKEENLGALIDEVEGKVDNETIAPIQQKLIDIGDKTNTMNTKIGVLEKFMGDQGPMIKTHSTDISSLQAEIATMKSQIEGLNTKLQALEKAES